MAGTFSKFTEYSEKSSIAFVCSYAAGERLIQTSQRKNSRENFAYVDMHEYIKTTIKFSQHFIYLTEWFQQQTEFTTDFEEMEVNEMNKYLSKFYVSVRRKDETFYKRNSLLSVRAVLDRHVISAHSCFLMRDNDK